jgi:hypothetical protein
MKETTMLTTTALTAARAEALFTSDLATGSQPTRHAVEQAIRAAIRARGGVRGCAAEVAGEYGDHPELAMPRMRWARSVVDCLYQDRHTRIRRRASRWALAA